MEETKINEIWETYRACWSEAITSERDNKLQEIIAEDFEYYDPNQVLEGYRRLSDYMAQFQKEFAGCTFTITDFSVHHNRSSAHWNMLSPDNEVLGHGVDYAFYANEKLKTISSFFKEG